MTSTNPSQPSAGPRQLQPTSARFASPKQLTKRSSQHSASNSTSLNPQASPLFNAAAYQKISSSHHGSYASSQSSRHTSAKPSVDIQHSQRPSSSSSSSTLTTAIDVTKTHPAYEHFAASSSDQRSHDPAVHHPAATKISSSAHAQLQSSSIKSHMPSLSFSSRSASAGNPRSHHPYPHELADKASATLHQASSFIKSLLPQMSTNSEVVQSAVSSITHMSDSEHSKATQQQQVPTVARVLRDITVVAAAAAALYSSSRYIDQLRKVTR